MKSPLKTTAELLSQLPSAVRQNVLLKLHCVERMSEAQPGKANATARELSIAHGYRVQSIQRWVGAFKRHGIEGLIDRRQIVKA